MWVSRKRDEALSVLLRELYKIQRQAEAMCDCDPDVEELGWEKGCPHCELYERLWGTVAYFTEVYYFGR